MADAPSNGLKTFIDRWIYVFTAALFIVITLAAFIPDSIIMLGNVEAGKRPPLPLVLHLHAVAMGGWLLLLLAQTVLMATGRSAGHRQLGIAGLVLAPAIVLIGVVLAPIMYHQMWNGLHSLPGGLDDAARMGLTVRGRITLLQLQAGIMFAAVVALALRARGKDDATHKRLMILVPAMPLVAAYDRLICLPNTFPFSPLGSEGYVLIAIAPILLWDVYRSGRIHSAYRIWLALFLLTSLVVNLLWNSEWWQSIVPRMMGVA